MSKLPNWLAVEILWFEKELAVSDVASSREGIRARKLTRQTDSSLEGSALSFRSKLSWYFRAETTRLSPPNIAPINQNPPGKKKALAREEH